MPGWSWPMAERATNRFMKGLAFKGQSPRGLSHFKAKDLQMKRPFQLEKAFSYSVESENYLPKTLATANSGLSLNILDAIGSKATAALIISLALSLSSLAKAMMVSLASAGSV